MKKREGESFSILRFRKKSLYVRIFVCMLLLSGFLSSVLVGALLKAAEERYFQSICAIAQTALDKVQTAMDIVIQQSEETLLWASQNQDLLSVVEEPGTSNEERNYRIIQFLSGLSERSSYAEGVYFYSSSDDVIYTSNGFCQPLKTHSMRNVVRSYVEGNPRQVSTDAQGNQISCFLYGGFCFWSFLKMQPRSFCGPMGRLDLSRCLLRKGFAF